MARRRSLRPPGAEGAEDHRQPRRQLTSDERLYRRFAVLCSIGRGSDQAWATTRAGIARIGNSYVMDKNFDPIQMGLVPEEALAHSSPKIDALPLPARARRMLRLAVPGLRALAAELQTPAPLLIGLPELSEAESPWLRDIPEFLQQLTGAPIDIENSGVIPRGRAAALIALEFAFSEVQNDPSRTIIVGGVDTYFDLRLLASLDAEAHPRPASHGRFHSR